MQELFMFSLNHGMNEAESDQQVPGIMEVMQKRIAEPV